MLSKKNNVTKTNTPQLGVNNLNDYLIKIDYFDQKGIKNYENSIPLKCIFNAEIRLPKSN